MYFCTKLQLGIWKLEAEPPCLGEHGKLSILCLIASRSWRLTVPSYFETEGTKNAPVFVHGLIHYYIFNVVAGVR